MKKFNIYFTVVLIMVVWAYVTSLITDYVFNRPVHEFIQMFFSLAILTYSYFCFYYIYKLLFNSFKAKKQ